MEDLIRRSDAIKEMEQRYQDILRIFKRKVKDGEKAIALDMIGCVKSLPSADRPSESIGKLIERMEEYRDKQLLMSDYWYGINWAINTIRVSDIADRPQGWIPCSERLPEKQTTVLYSLEGCVSVAFMTDRNYTGETVELYWEDLETGITIYPEAWMPLPEPWKGADDDL